KENVIFLGPAGVGKTHLAISLAIAAAQSGRRVYYGTLSDLITSLEEAQTAGKLQQRLKVLTHPAVLVVDTPSPYWSGHLGEVMLDLFEEEENGGISQGRRWAPAVHDRLQEGADRPRPPGRDYAFGACA